MTAVDMLLRSGCLVRRGWFCLSRCVVCGDAAARLALIQAIEPLSRLPTSPIPNKTHAGNTAVADAFAPHPTSVEAGCFGPRRPAWGVQTDSRAALNQTVLRRIAPARLRNAH